MLALSQISQASDVCGDSFNFKKVQIDEDELLFVVLRVNSRPMSSSIDLYPYQDTYLLPISQLGDHFKLPWKFQRSPQRFYSQNAENTGLACDFDINFSPEIKGEDAFWYEDDFDTYVDVNVIAKLLEGEVSLNYELLQINFTSALETLGLDRSSDVTVPGFFSSYKPKEYPIVPDRYKLFSLPLINYRTNFSYAEKQKKLKHRTNLNAFFDLAYLSADYRLSQSNDRSQQFLRFSRNIALNVDDSTRRASLDQINDRTIKYEFGDVSLESDELVDAATQGLGFSIFSHSENERRNFSTIRIEETALPGWRGLLFRNSQFIEEVEANDSNELVFENVPTFFGINTFEIRLYGPEGQEETRQQIINVGSQSLTTGEFDFRMQASDATRRLLEGVVADNDRARQFSASGRLGVTNSTKVSTSYHRQDSKNGIQDYASASVDITIGGNLVRIKHAEQLNAGNATFIGINSRLSKDFSSNFSHTRLSNFDSARYDSQRGMKQDTRFRLNTRIDLDRTYNVSAALSQRKFENGDTNRSVSASVNHDFMGSTLSNSVEYATNSNDKLFTHRTFWTQSIDDWRVRHSVAWQPFEGSKIQSYSANIRWPQKLKTFNETQLNYRRSGEHNFELSHRLNWRTDWFNLQFGSSINEDGNWSFKLGISGDLYFDKHKKRPNFSRPRGSSLAEINAFAFIDHNRNNVFDEEDEAVPDVGFSGKSAWKEVRSTQQGNTQLFTTARYQKIEIDENTLFDPFISPSTDGAIVATHQGGSNDISFPLVPVNDIEGYVAFSNGESAIGLGGMKILLLMLGSGEYFETKTESDGFFFFTKVPPGTYKILLEQDYLDDRDIAKPQDPIIIEAPKFGDIISLPTISLVNVKTAQQQLIDKIHSQAIGFSKHAKTGFIELKQTLAQINAERLRAQPTLAMDTTMLLPH